MSVDKSKLTTENSCNFFKNENNSSCSMELSPLSLTKEEISTYNNCGNIESIHTNSDINSTNNTYLNSLNTCIENNNYIVKTEENFNNLETSFMIFEEESHDDLGYEMFQSNNNVLKDKFQLEIEYDDKIIKIGKETFEDYVIESEIEIEKNGIRQILEEENVNNIAFMNPSKPIFSELHYYNNEVIQNKHNSENPIYNCNSCNQSFNSKKSLIFHINNLKHHISSNDVPKKSCLDSIKFKPINKSILKKKSFQCEICLKNFTDYSNCRRHIQNHTSIVKLKTLQKCKCLICMKTFSSKYNLQVHNRIHTGETPYKCDICLVTFNRNDTMLLHKMNHGEECSTTKYCDKCNKSFQSNSSFLRHKRLHLNEKRFPCTYCQKSYTRNDLLISHMRSKHTGERPYQCNICKKSFSEKCVLVCHIKSHKK